MSKICIIGIYFGKLPEYIDLWLESCKYNKNIDFLIVTDQEISNKPKNVNVHRINLADFRNMASDKLKLEVCLKKPYKCCDLKPVYGVILNDFLSGYDFWGHCDFDMIFGDLESYFNKHNLEKYDKFLHLGHLSLYRNNDECNNRYKLDGSLVGDFIDVFTSPLNFGFDEKGGIYQIYKKHGFPMFDQRIFADISKIYKRFQLALSDNNYINQIFYWENGKVYRAYIENQEIKQDEFIYIHFKERNFCKQNFDINRVKSFYITPEGFVAKEPGLPTEMDIRKLNPYKGKLTEQLEKVKFKVECQKRRINNAIEKYIINRI